MTQSMKYCASCGGRIEYRIPDGDDRERAVCLECGTIHYVNPRVVVGCVAEWQGRVLMARRSIEPRAGFWTLPAGFLEMGETTENAGARETWEEACAEVRMGPLFACVDVTHIGQIHMFYRAEMVDGEHAPGPESVETQLMREDDIPWSQLAFPTVYYTLERYFADRRDGRFGMHTEGLAPGSWRRMNLDREPAQPVTD